MSTIGERLKSERKRLVMNQEEFAAVAGITKRPYIEWEGGRTSPTALQLAALANVGADVQYIVTGIRSETALAPDERQLLALYRSAPITGKAAAVGALQGVLAGGNVQTVKSNKGQLTQTGQVVVVGGAKKGRK